jgi:hypothetical protein
MICARAVAFYEYGPAVAPLPEGMTTADRGLVAAMLDMLARTELERQFGAPSGCARCLRQAMMRGRSDRFACCRSRS